jgi:hypothetical protein
VKGGLLRMGGVGVGRRRVGKGGRGVYLRRVEMGNVERGRMRNEKEVGERVWSMHYRLGSCVC